MRRVAIHSGGQDDFSVEHLDVKDNVDLEAEKKKWDNWYKNEYLPALRSGTKTQFYTFAEGLIKLGLAVKNTDIEIFEED